MKNPLHQIRNFFSYWNAFGFRGAVDVARGWRQSENLFPIHVNFCGETLWVRRDNTDFPVLKQATVFRSRFTPPGFQPQVVLDLGANVGMTTSIFAARWPEARVIAIEPELQNFELLQRNCQPFSNIEALQAAIWIRDEELTIANPQAKSFEFRVGRQQRGDSSSQQSQLVQGITIPTLMQNMNLDTLDVVKIDIEGAEKTLFESDTMKWMSHVRVLIIELHDRFEPGCSDAVFKAVQPFNPHHFQIGEYEVFQFPA